MQRIRRPTLTVLVLIGAATLGACAEQAPTAAEFGAPSFRRSSSPTGEYLILGAADALPADLEASVAAAGGTVIRSYPELGVAVARATEAGFADRASRIGGVESVTEDRLVQLVDPDRHVVAFDAADAMASALPAANPDDDTFFPLQWPVRAVDAPAAWAAGYTGSGVRVAILDGGIFDLHPDLQQNVDGAASRSFVPGFAFNEDVGTFWHGTHVAGIVAAVDNQTGVIGIAPNATLIGVKVLHNEVGTFGALIAGIFYAATPLGPNGAGADVINMSLGVLVENARDQAIWTEVRELIKGVDRATRYAHRQGVVVIGAAGNDTTNLDEERSSMVIPSQAQHVITVTATAPLGWALGNDDFDRLASYSNTGRSLVDFAAPGGDDVYPGDEICTIVIQLPCWVFDTYLSTSRGGYAFAIGTSAAAPVAAGIAALVIEKAGGNITPNEVEALMRQGALDRGAPGTDPVYGHGWLNALGAVLATPEAAADKKGRSPAEPARPGSVRRK